MNQKTKYTVFTAVLIALMLVLQLTGIGLINLGIINITLYCTVIAIGTETLGLPCGLTLGGVFGIISTWKAVQAPTALVAPLMQASPLFTILMCLLPRLLVPLGVYLARKAMKQSKLGNAVAAACGSLINTFLYLGLMLAGYALTVADNPTLLTTLGTIALTAGLPEAIAAGLIAPPIVSALQKIIR